MSLNPSHWTFSIGLSYHSKMLQSAMSPQCGTQLSTGRSALWVMKQIMWIKREYLWFCWIDLILKICPSDEVIWRNEWSRPVTLCGLSAAEPADFSFHSTHSSSSSSSSFPYSSFLKPDSLKCWAETSERHDFINEKRTPSKDLLMMASY